MSNWRYDTLEDYVESARRRVADALELLEEPSHDSEGRGALTRHLPCAYYVAGYAVECELKAYLLCLHPACRRFSEVARHCGLDRGSGTHSIAPLWRATRLDAVCPEPLRRDIGALAGWWSVEVRYLGRFQFSRGLVRQRVGSVVRLFHWLVQQRKGL